MSVHQRRRPVFIASLIYRDNRAAMHWLRAAFGFDVAHVLVDRKGDIVHAEMMFGEGVIMIGSEWAEWTRSPQSVGGANTQRLHVRIEQDIDGHCERARAAGAIIVRGPADEFYGERCYLAVDPEGHHWTFSQPVREVTLDEMERATGFRLQRLAAD